jgi:hypothetical protein
MASTGTYGSTRNGPGGLLTAALAAALLAGGCVTAPSRVTPVPDPVPVAAPAAVPATADRPPFSFAWPAPALVPVTVEAESLGRRARARYVLAVSPSSTGNGFEIRPQDAELLHLDAGDEAGGPMRAGTALFAASAAAPPGYSVGADGRITAVTGLADTLAALAEADAFSGHPADRDLARGLMRSAAVQDVLTAAAEEPWTAWVGSWIDFAAAPGGSTVGMVPVAVEGRRLMRPALLENLGPDREFSCCVRLRATARLDGPELEAALSRLPPGLVPVLAGARSAEARLDAVARETVTEAVIDPATLRPVHVRSEEWVVLHIAGKPVRAGLGRRDYRFGWPDLD